MSVNAEPHDAELILRMASGDQEAYAELFRRHQATVFRFSRQMLGSTDAAEDVTQDVFVALARNVRHFDPALGSVTTYLYGIARNLILQRHKRSRWHHVTIESLENDHDPVATTCDPADALTRQQMQRHLRLAILRLPVHYREVVVLCELNGLSYEDAANIAGCPIGTIRSRLSRARDILIARCRTLLMDEQPKAETQAPKTQGARKWQLAAKNNC